MLCRFSSSFCIESNYYKIESNSYHNCERIVTVANSQNVALCRAMYKLLKSFIMYIGNGSTNICLRNLFRALYQEIQRDKTYTH